MTITMICNSFTYVFNIDSFNATDSKADNPGEVKIGKRIFYK